MLVATGRRPNSANLGLEETRVTLDARGFIDVDHQRRTNEPSIFAIGDVAGEPMLAHKATHEARVAVEAIAGEPVAWEPAAIPAVVYTDPEIAWCGLTETEASHRGIDIQVTRFPWTASGRATTMGRPHGVTKLIVEPGTERILGVGIAGPRRGRADRRGRARGRDGRSPRRPAPDDPPAPHAVRDPDGGGRGRSSASARTTSPNAGSPALLSPLEYSRVWLEHSPLDDRKGDLAEHAETCSESPRACRG